MKIFKRSVYAVLLALGLAGTMQAADYGLPSGIQEGNILHCFNWPIKEIQGELANIAAAGFGSIQISPCQRADINVGSSWHDLYRPYDLAFKSSGYCSEQDLKDLCAEAANYGIKIIVDVVANHVDKTAGYHDTWWDSNERVRWYGGINYGDRYSITHGQLGDYGDINSELSEVCARGKAYVEKLASLGVKGIRWDAAKHIGLPSEDCAFWSSVTSVPGVWHYGEILDNPGPNASIIKEYTNYMSVTDNRYCNYAARENGGIPGGYGGDWVVNQGCPDTKMVYWAESHDTYSNDEWSQNVDQSVIDRAYAAYASRNGAAALYLSRPNAKGFNNIKIGKGSVAFKNKQVAEVNKFRNLMAGKKDWFESDGNACSITRQDGGAVIVMKGSGNVTVTNGGGYCPVGTYTDHVSGATFTVTATTISGNVGSSGIAVIYNDGITPDPDPDPDPTPGTVTITGDYNIAYSGTKAKVYYWGGNNPCSTYPGITMTTATGSDGKSYKVAKIDATSTGCLFNTNGDQDKTDDLTYTGSFIMDDNGATTTAVVFENGDTPDPDPDPTPDGVTIYYDNSGTNWSTVKIHYWSNPATTWPGVDMTKVEGNIWKYTFTKDPSTLSGFLFNNGSGDQTGDYAKAPVANHIYKGKGSKGEVTDEGEYQGGTDPQKPVVVANPASGARFAEELKVTLTVTPAATIYYTLDGNAATTSSTKYTSPITLTETTTIKTLAVSAEGVQNAQSFSYTKNSSPVPPSDNTLITDYYKVNPNGQVGSNRTVNMKFTKLNNDNRMCVADNALSNWTEADLIAQGVARDIASAFKGKHEYPVIDSYAIYAAYDAQNLYLGVQYVYTIWDLYGDGKLTNGAAKPYNMDGRIMIAFDLDPEKKMDGVLGNGNTIWDEDGQYNTFDNEADCFWLGSTKSTVGTPGLFFPTADGSASYDSEYCISLDAPFYGCQDGLLPSIQHIWGQKEFEYDPELLKGNEGFVDLIDEIPQDQHTFYEWKFPLSKLGITEDYIKNVGIGVMVVDTYGQGATGSTPYDPTVFDNAKTPYSKEESSSAEKEDKDIFTYSLARIGKARSVGVNNIADEFAADAEPVYYNLQGVRVNNPENGVYIVRRGNKVTKEVIR